ncbi:hypothetical protein NBRC10512_000362 [Rhodotorula toruloides]|uniref:RHTO0S26e01112g1_1 n=2 Tax=Rhodotorula toruloides TaxID=5286 RepID=A0A061BHG3_RHOTO|nr:uncharacterized protein RHTO_01780 [Rhodotorula toruloides NP11]EMS21314.1 hypothetical protein RHTO_01780 [Rhodotorula toruloides NP11]CDR49408.1 RHTO0S26e01112g1_1 [Rhodotorula toruloides]
MTSRDDYASLALSSISWFTPANKHVFPELCKGKFTDVDLYCATGTSDLCCGLCPNTWVSGLGQSVWAIISYGIASLAYILAPGEVWGLAVMQVMLANAFIFAGLIRVWAGASDGGMAKWQVQFLWPQALAFIFIMAPAILTPQWARLGRSQLDMEKMLIRLTGDARRVTRAQLREAEVRLVKRQHQTWSWCVLTFWFVNMVFWTVGFVWASRADIDYAQSNCDDVVQPTLTPVIATCILGVIAWLMVFFDAWIFLGKNKIGGSDYLIDVWDRHFGKTGVQRTWKEHRRLERKVTIGVTVGLFFLWLILDCWMYLEGINKFLLSGSDFVTFGQVEQFTALFPDLLGLFTALQAYFSSRDELNTWRKESTSSEHNGGPGGEESSDQPHRMSLPPTPSRTSLHPAPSRPSSFNFDPDAAMELVRQRPASTHSNSHSHSSSSASAQTKGKKRASSISTFGSRRFEEISTDSEDAYAPGPSTRVTDRKKEDYGSSSHAAHSSHSSSHDSHHSDSVRESRHDSHHSPLHRAPSTSTSQYDSLLDLYDRSRPSTRQSSSHGHNEGEGANPRASFSSFKNRYLDTDPEEFHERVVRQQSLGRGARGESRRRRRERE